MFLRCLRPCGPENGPSPIHVGDKRPIDHRRWIQNRCPCEAGYGWTGALVNARGGSRRRDGIPRVTACLRYPGPGTRQLDSALVNARWAAGSALLLTGPAVCS
jgi:hypothetical protein